MTFMLSLYTTGVMPGAENMVGLPFSVAIVAVRSFVILFLFDVMLQLLVW